MIKFSVVEWEFKDIQNGMILDDRKLIHKMKNNFV